jgi:hypothetical protein
MTQKPGMKQYVTPKLTHYGAVRDMTQGSSGAYDYPPKGKGKGKGKKGW